MRPISDSTIVYYTSNGDYPQLEQAVRDTIRAHSRGLPIISVSQEPIDFGHNICVGDIGRSRHNIYKQLRIGAEHARTSNVVVCEADFLYPPQFFRFTPDKVDTYYYPTECYILFKRSRDFRRKKMHQLTGVVDRLHLLSILDRLEEHDNPETALERFHLPRYLPNLTFMEEFDAGPVVTLKTDRQMHGRSSFSKVWKRRWLPIWGSEDDVWRNYPCD